MAGAKLTQAGESLRELVASDVMRKRIRDKFGWDVEVPELFEEVEV